MLTIMKFPEWARTVGMMPSDCRAEEAEAGVLELEGSASTNWLTAGRLAAPSCRSWEARLAVDEEGIADVERGWNGEAITIARRIMMA